MLKIKWPKFMNFASKKLNLLSESCLQPIPKYIFYDM